MKKAYQSINDLLSRAEKEGRSHLLEPEVYFLFKQIGLKVPNFIFLSKERKLEVEELKKLKSEEVVIKVVSPLIPHKTDVGGVRFVANEIKEIRENLAIMLEEIPFKWLDWAQRKGIVDREKSDFDSKKVRDSIKGFLIVEKIKFKKIGLGEELLLGLKQTRDFGPIITLGFGGTDVDYLVPRLREGQALGFFSPSFRGQKKLLAQLSTLAFYEKLVQGPRGGAPVIEVSRLIEVIKKLAGLAKNFSIFAPGQGYVLEELEANPVVISSGEFIPLDGLARFSQEKVKRLRPPAEALKFLLFPESIGLIGVSEKMNLGHIILNNILKEGFPPEKVYIVKPGSETIESCRCFPSVADLPETVDLFVYALPAEHVYSCLESLIIEKKAKSMIIIAGGLGEKKGTENEEKRIRELIEKARRENSFAPIINGANCLGIISRPGRYDTTFIPEYKFPRPREGKPGLIFISQSGAFMITRLNKSPWLAPEMAISIGNQIDLTVADYLDYFARNEDQRPKLYALYLEGLREGDGLVLARASSKLIKAGSRIIVYKGGRTPQGKLATTSHTASVAGDYEIFKSLISQQGVYVAETLSEFENGMKALFSLINKKSRGARVGFLSNAGFECVIMADHIMPDGVLKLARWSQKTRDRLQAALAPLGIDRLQDIRNPLDLTPVADDLAFAACVEAVLEDPGVDCVVVSPVPMTPALKTLVAPDQGEDFHQPSTLASKLVQLFHQNPKPFVVSLDAGAIYDPLADYLEKNGLPLFRRVDEALRFLAKFVRL
ncbi:MAG: acetate--CoA ligase family protein [Candidatus Aminicenantes bacterium]|nr:acetate--CoA ligase family protein [Candidatus Aminicenantes bacterium]